MTLQQLTNDFFFFFFFLTSLQVPGTILIRNIHFDGYLIDFHLDVCQITIAKCVVNGVSCWLLILHWSVQKSDTPQPPLYLIKFFGSIRQNAELAKLHQDCIRLNKDLVEKNEALQTEEQLRKNLESKAATAEKKLTQLQVRSLPFLNHSAHHRHQSFLFSLLNCS